MNTDFTLDELKLIRQTALSNHQRPSPATSIWDSIAVKASLSIADEVCKPPKLDVPQEGNGK